MTNKDLLGKENLPPFKGKFIVDTEELPIKLWLPEAEMEPDTLQQAKDLANLPFAHGHISIMPDSHLGYGMPIGAVLPTKDAIVPNAVGVDIGCGMCSLRTDFKSIDKPDLKEILGIIRKTVPVGFKKHEEAQDEKWMPEKKGDLPIVEQEYEKGLYQVGTLGGGNHFIEIQEGSDGYIWIMVHSGSRNIGYTVAKHYNDIAKKINEESGGKLPKDLAAIPKSSKYFELYRNEMNYCIDFALANRKLMMERVKNAFLEVLPESQFSHFINKPHNFADEEKHLGEELIIHRKGATRARKGEWGMIPGSQGTESYLVMGKGEKHSFASCAHGAGRVMSRTQARKKLDFKEEVKALKKQGVLHGMRHKSDLDEAPSSYKNIKNVMKNQKDLIDVKVTLKPLAVVKA